MLKDNHSDKLRTFAYTTRGQAEVYGKYTDKSFEGFGDSQPGSQPTGAIVGDGPLKEKESWETHLKETNNLLVEELNDIGTT